MLEVRGLTVRYGGHLAVEDVSLGVARGEVLAVLGPSGAGKTTLLRAIVGLEQPAAGSIAWDGAEITQTPVHARGFGVVFQDLALFPHRDVGSNVAFGLRMRGVPRDEATSRVASALDRVGLAGFERRDVETLSGGELQRVAVARALVTEPGLLLLDEPMTALDRPLRDRLIGDLRRLLAEAEVAAVYVTHDRQDALAVGTHVAVMRAGRIVRHGPTAEVWRRPETEFVARFLGISSFLPGEDAGRLVAVPVDAVRLAPEGEITGRVVDVGFRGDHFVVRFTTSDGPLDVAVDPGAVPQPGDEARLTVDRTRTAVVRRDTDPA